MVVGAGTEFGVCCTAAGAGVDCTDVGGDVGGGPIEAVSGWVAGRRIMNTSPSAMRITAAAAISSALLPSLALEQREAFSGG